MTDLKDRLAELCASAREHEQERLRTASLVPFREKFRVRGGYHRGRFYLQILFGFVNIRIARRWDIYYSVSSVLHSQILIGWIPWRIRVGEVMPCWSLFHREWRGVQWVESEGGK